MLYFGFGILYSVCSAEAVQCIAMQKLTEQQFTVVCEVGGDNGTICNMQCSMQYNMRCNMQCGAI